MEYQKSRFCVLVLLVGFYMGVVMNFVKKISFLLSSIFLFLIISCSNGMLNSTNISLCFDVSQLYNKSSDISRNDILLNNNQVFRGKLNVAIYQIKDVNAPESYVDFDDTKFKKISSSSGDVAIDGTVSVVLNEVPVGVKAFIVAELFNEQNGDLELAYAGLSNTFEVTEGTNVVELELRSIVNKVTYELTFVLGDGAKWIEDYIAPAIYSEEDASDIDLPSKEDIFRENYIFDGWYDNAEYNGTALINLEGKTGDLTLYARWRAENQVATVQFSEPAGGVDMATEITLSCETEGATIYYTIDGSDPQISTNRITYSDDEKIYIKAETTIKAYATKANSEMTDSDVSTINYTLNVYTLNFDANGGTLPRDMQSSVEVISGNSYDFANFVPTKEGCIFKGWYLSETPDEFVTNYEPNIENTPTKTVTIYAKWENTATITVTMPTYSDISELEKPIENNNGSLTFTAPESPTGGVTYTHNIWYVNGVYDNQNKYPTNEWTFDTTSEPGGIYTIMLVVEDSSGNKYSAEYQVTVTK